MTLHDAFNYFLAAKRINCSPRTIEWYEQRIGKFIAWLEAMRIGSDWVRPETIEAYLANERDSGLSPATVLASYTALRSFLGWLKKRKYLSENPLELVERPSTPERPPRRALLNDVQQLIRSIPRGSWVDLRDRAIVQSMLATGMRLGDVASLWVSDVDLDSRWVYIRAGKNDKDRYAPFDRASKEELTLYLLARPQWRGPELFVAATGHLNVAGPMTGNAIRVMMRRRCVKAGLDVINPHSLRHLFATKALNEGVSLAAVSTILGHHSPAFTAKVYAKWVKSGLRAEYDAAWGKGNIEGI